MPTPKQVRHHYSKIAKLRWRLACALNAAHNADVIQYSDYNEESPCKSLGECWERFNKTVEKQLARAIKDEIMKDVIY